MRESIDIVPTDRWEEAIDLLLSRMPHEVQPHERVAVRAAIAGDSRAAAGLLGHFRGDNLTAVCWLQRQSGRTAHLWPPVFCARSDPNIAMALIDRAISTSHQVGAAMVQSLLVTDAGDEAEVLLQAGFQQIADLLYLVSVSSSFPSSRPQTELGFVPRSQTEMWRFERIVERTYVDTQDCPAMNGMRAVGDVLEGYRAVGTFRPDLWFIVCSKEQDIGCALVADHAPEPVWELLYTGIVPEARGKSLGLEVMRHIQWLAARDQVERLVLAVDAANEPAITIYAAAGFAAWDRRSVFVRVL